MQHSEHHKANHAWQQKGEHQGDESNCTRRDANYSGNGKPLICPAVNVAARRLEGVLLQAQTKECTCREDCKTPKEPGAVHTSKHA